MGYRPWGRKELDVTERLTNTRTHTHAHTHTRTRISPRRDRQTDEQVCSGETRQEDAPIHPGFEGRPRRALRGETLGTAQLSGRTCVCVVRFFRVTT